MKRRGAHPNLRVVAFVGLAVFSACRPGTRAASRDEPAASASTVASSLEPPDHRVEPSPGSRCAAIERVPVFEGGERRDELCPAEVTARGLTSIDLSDAWLPHAFDDEPGTPHGTFGFRRELTLLSTERFDALPPEHRAKSDRYLELYGIEPALAVLRQRLRDHERHRCHDGIDNAPLRALDVAVDAWRSVDEQRSDRAVATRWGKELDRIRRMRHLNDIDALATDLTLAPHVRAWKALRTRLDAVAAAQRHLRCDGGYREAEPGIFDEPTRLALERYLRHHARITWTLDHEAAETLATDSRTLEWRALLRAVRERVVDATGLLEDGSAKNAEGRVLGEKLDSEALVRVVGHTPLDGAADDLVSRATEEVVRALGWTSPGEVMSFFAKHPGSLGRVAVKLTPNPAYHAAHMDLRAEIDRGDVRYEYPFNSVGEDRVGPVERRPALILYAKDGGSWKPLVRWGTTIGDWKPERLGKRVVLAYKESPVGARIWRDLVLAPRWLPPESTPGRDLVVPTPAGGYTLRRDLLGPSYASAYGLAMLVHHLPQGREFVDQGIRTHGSVSYDSIHKGASHGCHRLHNHRVVRLAGFLLAHRTHVRHGEEPFAMSRSFRIGSEDVRVSMDTRGFRYELSPPVPVEVLAGRVVGRESHARTSPVELPPNLAPRFRADLHD